jgi:hypothetical protein
VKHSHFPLFQEDKESTMAVASFIAPTPGFADSAFGNLVDLARLRAGTAHAEVCDVCNTINMGSARLCKCCAHKLPAFYAGTPPTLRVAHCGRFAGCCRDIHRFFVAHFALAVEAPQ